MPEAPTDSGSRNRIANVSLDQVSIRRSNSSVDHEREVAIYDILDGNSFEVEGADAGPYNLVLSISEDRLVFAVSDQGDAPIVNHALSLTPLRKVISDYFLVCESYYEAIRTAPPSRIQSIDMGRRGLHDEGSRLLCERLEGKIKVDRDTARRLFTLVCALHWKG